MDMIFECSRRFPAGGSLKKRADKMQGVRIGMASKCLVLLQAIILSSCGFMSENGRNFAQPEGPFYSQSGRANSGSDDSSAITVASFNIKYAENVDKAIELLGRGRTKDADIVLLQELDSESVRLVADALEYNYVYYPAVIHPKSRKEFGNAILSKWPIEDHEKIILPHLDPDGMQRIAVAGIVTVNGTELAVYNVHLGKHLRARLRAEQVADILNRIGKTNPEYCLVGGDFNTYTGHYTRAVVELFERDSFRHVSSRLDWTFRLHFLGVSWKKLTLDHVFARGLRVLESGKTEDDIGASDHAPIWVVLSWL